MARPSGTLRAAKNALTVVVEPVFRLVVTKGPDAGKAFRLDGSEAPRVLLGTSPACELGLSDRKVSRRHLAIELSGGVIHMRDLGSTNGTRVNGVSIGEVSLRGGEAIEVGDCTLALVKGDEDGDGLVSDETHFGRTLGQSVAMRRLYPICRRLAASTVPLVIEGETGTGKELLAETIHEESARAGGPFVVLDCAGVAASSVELALFGDASRPGLFEEARGGTLLLDEVGELDLAVQPKLLRAVERGEIRKTDGSVVPVDVRIVTTTRRDLDREVAEGRFREDLFFRVAVTRIELPPLRKRPEDVDLLARAFWTRASTGEFPEAALERRRSYEWPGNVRELENFVVRLAALGEEPTTAIAASAGPKGHDTIDRIIAEHLPLTRAREKLVEEFERRYVEDAFIRNDRNVTKAAEAAGIARRYFRALRARQRG